MPTAEKQIELDLEGELRKRWQRQEIKNYMMLSNSFIGDKMPRTRLDRAIKALTPEQKLSFRRLAVATLVEVK